MSAIPLAALSKVTDKQIAACAEVKNSVHRLECFDKVASDAGLLRNVKTSAPAGEWKVSEDISKIDDSRIVYLSVPADEPFVTGYKRGHPTLWLRCAENRTTMFITYGVFLTVGEIDVLLRVDKEKAFRQTWDASTDNKAVFARKPIREAKRLLGRSTLLVQITPHGENPVTSTFPIAGLDKSITPLRKQCGW